VILIWSNQARADRLRIIRYIRQYNARAAFALDQQFSAKAQLLIHHPYMGRPSGTPGTRELVVHPNYILFYAVSSTHIHVLRIRHAAQHPR